MGGVGMGDSQIEKEKRNRWEHNKKTRIQKTRRSIEKKKRSGKVQKNKQKKKTSG
jgi:hypothetical protein